MTSPAPIPPTLQRFPIRKVAVLGAGVMGAQIAAWEVSRATFNAVPEPATWQLMMIGAGLIGWTLRRRGKAIADVRA